MSDKVYISSQDNQVNLSQNNNILVITDSDQNQVIVTQPVTNVIEVNVPGPQGPVGPMPDTSSLVGTGSFNAFTASMYAFTSSYNTGSFTGSFTGSLLGTASWAIQAITASYADNFRVSGSISEVDYIDFDTSATGIQPSLARLSWNQTDKTLEVGTGDGNTTLQIGQETVYPPIVNKDSIDLIQGTLVMVDPTDVAQGNRLRVIRAVTNGTYPSQLIVGVLTEDILRNGEGFATWFGYVRNLPLLTLQPAGETWTEGQILYPNPNIPGGLTNVRPGAPNIDATIAAITSINGQNLTLLVRPLLTFTLGELNDVALSGSVNGDLITKSGSIWVSGKSLVGSYNITGSLTISGSSTLRNVGPAIFSGSLVVTQGITGSYTGSLSGSVHGTSSWASNAITASYALNVPLTASYANQALSSSYAFTASYALNAGTTIDTGSLVTTSSFNQFTSSYYTDSSSFNNRLTSNSASISQLSSSFLTVSSSLSTRVTSLEQFSSSLDATFATDAQLNAATASLSSSIAALSSSYLASSASFNTRLLNNSSSVAQLSSSFLSFSSSYNTGSFTGSFRGDGSGLTNIPASGITGLNLSQIASGSVTASISPNNGFVVNTNTNIQGNLTASAALINGDLRIKGTASVDVLITNYESSSIIYSSGSTKFGDTLDDTHQYTGSLYVTGSEFTWNGSTIISSNVTSSMSVLNAVTASNTILQNTILTNQTVGALTSGTNLPAGTGLESILRTMLVTYIPPTLSSLVMRIGGSNISTAARDVGNSFTTDTASFSATADNPTGIFPISSSWTASGADIGTQTFYFGNNVLTTSNVRSVGSVYTINRATTNGTVTFTVNGRRSDTGAAITGATTSISFQWRNYLAASSTIPTSNATAQTVVNASVASALDTDRAWTATCTAANDTTGNFTYVIYPASYGNLSNIIQNGALSVLSAFTNLGDFTITNAYGASILVRIYKSNSDKAFASGTTLAIS